MTLSENSIVNALNSYFIKNKINAEAYRLYQSEFSPGQKCDIICDSLNPDYYLALECKSMDAVKYKTFNFKSRFSSSEGMFQLEKEYKFCKRTGRKGFVVIELRNGAGKPKTCHFIPIDYLYTLWKNNVKSIKVDEIREFPSLDREKGKYIIPYLFLEKTI